MVDSTFKTIVRNLPKYILGNIQDIIMEEHVPELIDMIMADYDAELISRVTDRRSRTNPLYYRDEFTEALENFDWITGEGNSRKFLVPSMTNFNFNQGRLHIIQNVLEGTIGVYVEADETQYVQMYGKRPTFAPYDKTVPVKQRMYLLKYNSDVKRRERQKFGRSNVLPRYPFSNSPAIDLFGPTQDYVQENFGKWVHEANKTAAKQYSKRGAL